MYVPVTMRMGDGVTVYNRELQGLAARASDLTVPLTQIGRDLKVGIGKQFESEGAWAYDWPYPKTSPWERLSDPYRRWKEEHYPGRPILVKTGTMRGQSVLSGPVVVTPKHLMYTPRDARVTRQYMHRRVNHRLVDAPHSVTYNMAEIAYYHQTGAGNNPRRPMVAWTLGELREWDRILIAYLNGREPFSTRWRP